MSDARDPRVDPRPGDVPAVVDAMRRHIGASGLTPQGFAEAINRLSGGKIAEEMEQMPTDALEWGVKFEAMERREQPKPLACACREALEELLLCHASGGFVQPDGHVLEAARIALSTPCPTAAVLAEKDSEIVLLRVLREQAKERAESAEALLRECREALEMLMSDNLHSFPVGATAAARAALDRLKERG